MGRTYLPAFLDEVHARTNPTLCGLVCRAHPHEHTWCCAVCCRLPTALPSVSRVLSSPAGRPGELQVGMHRMCPFLTFDMCILPVLFECATHISCVCVCRLPHTPTTAASELSRLLRSNQLAPAFPELVAWISTVMASTPRPAATKRRPVRSPPPPARPAKRPRPPPA